MLVDVSQQVHCFQMLDEMLGRLNTSANIFALHMRSPMKRSRAICILIVVPSLRRTAPSQRIQMITSIEVLDELLGHLKTCPKLVKFVSCYIG